MNILAFRFTFFMAICLTLHQLMETHRYGRFLSRPNLLRTIFSRRLRCPVSTFWS